MITYIFNYLVHRKKKKRYYDYQFSIKLDLDFKDYVMEKPG